MLIKFGTLQKRKDEINYKIPHRYLSYSTNYDKADFLTQLIKRIHSEYFYSDKKGTGKLKIERFIKVSESLYVSDYESITLQDKYYPFNFIADLDKKRIFIKIENINKACPYEKRKAAISQNKANDWSSTLPNKDKFTESAFAFNEQNYHTKSKWGDFKPNKRKYWD